jgi:hypothetical protein
VFCGKVAGCTPHYLALVQDACVETVVKPIALEINLIRNPIVEGIIGEVIAVEFSRQVGVVYIVNLGNPRERRLSGGVDFATCRGWHRVASIFRAGASSLQKKKVL